MSQKIIFENASFCHQSSCDGGVVITTVLRVWSVVEQGCNEEIEIFVLHTNVQLSWLLL